MMIPMSQESVPPPAQGGPRDRLIGVRDALLQLHKALLESERIPYERERGRIATSGEFLNLVLNDPWFAWLHPLSALIVEIDEALSADEPAAEGLVAGFIERTRGLLTHGGTQFGPKYREVLQRDPSVLVAHGVVIGRLATVH
jgi:hypothetical protein